MLSSVQLHEEQLLALAACLPSFGPVDFPTLLCVFERSRAATVGSALAAAVASSPAANSVPPSELERVLNRYPSESTRAAQPRLSELRAQTAERTARLAALSSQVTAQGDALRGRALFESGAGACLTCHRIGEQGTDLGPDLSAIGRIRQPRDLLESSLFPNASLARDFEAHLIETNDGGTRMGLVRNETATTISLTLPGGVTTRISRQDIKSVQRAPVSLMPMGLETTLSEQQLLDLVAFLHALN
jgi:putative heme-binding domain-containing protein